MLRVAVRGLDTGRLMADFPFPYHRAHDVGPSHKSRTPTPPQRTPSPPVISTSHTPSPINRSPAGSPGAGAVRSDTELNIPSATSQGSDDVEISSSTIRSKSERIEEVTQREKE